jgi:hypothetical protein
VASACVLAVLLAAPIRSGATEDPFARTEDRGPCAEYTPLRRPFFGDLHVHTALSLDASTQGTRQRPRDAYRFARGEPLDIQPYTEEDEPRRHVRLDRPLDFAAVTDHAEFLGELHVCTTPWLPGHDSAACSIYRRWPRLAYFVLSSAGAGGERSFRWQFCGDGARDCLAAARTPWQEIRDAAEEAYDRTADCRFTSFVGYEWTGSPDSRNLHRNVVFRNATVPELPADCISHRTTPALWDAIERDCTAPCDALVIPHNSNLSAGLMFLDEDETGAPLTAESARRRARLEPLVELVQHKGDSECRLGAATQDELCAFEVLPYDRFLGKYAAGASEPAVATSFARGGLLAGLRLGAQLGVNPFRFGVVGGTDTHLGTPGLVAERGHVGHGGAGRPSATTLPPGLPDDVEYNPGGLSVVWAEENSRDALFEAMRRRETYSTSGPRIVVRLFAGWDYPADLCGRPDLVETGYAGGVAMGGVLPPRPTDDAAPVLVVDALRDPAGSLLQRVQIVKGWLENGEPRERVYDVAGDAANGARVDEATCTPSGPGTDGLCAVWRDPDFEPASPAFYYARVVENPTCRWHTYPCNAAKVRCDDPATVTEGFEGCCDEAYPRTIQERAVTSAVWWEGR